MTKAQLAAAIKAKYPVYQAVPDDELVSAILKKYPVYAGQLEPDPAKSQTLSGYLSDPNYGREIDEHGRPVVHEPDTWLGGFLKSLKDQAQPTLRAFKQTDKELQQPPQTAGDLASRIALTAIPEFMGATSALKPAMMSLGEEGKGLDLSTARKQLGKTLSTADKVVDLRRPLRGLKMAGDYLQKDRPPQSTEPGLVKRAIMRYEGAPKPDSGTSGSLEDMLSQISDEGPSAPMDARAEPGGGSVAETGPTSPQGQATPSTERFPPEGGQGDWHSGAEPGSAEAKGARALHRDTGEMDALYRLKLSDPLSALLLAIGGGSLANVDRQP